MGEQVSGVRVRLIVELRLGIRSFDLVLPAIPTAGEIIEIADGRRCVVEEVLDPPKDSPMAHYVYAAAEYS